MTRHPLRWFPPLVVGLCTASAAEVSVSLLLYGGPGLVRSLTAVLAVEAAALGMGFVSAPRPRPDMVDTLRRRWLLCLIVFLGATVFSALWSVVEEVGGSFWGQGLGLAFLAALPLYAGGGVLGTMTAAATEEPGGRPERVIGFAALGGAVGFAGTGSLLPQAFTPASLFLICLVLLSSGGLVYGSVLDRQLRTHVRARRPSALGDVCVEDRNRPYRGGGVRLLFEGGFVRRWISLDDEPPGHWDVAAFQSLAGDEADGTTALHVGGGASSLARAALWENRGLRLDVIERSQPVVELGREHLETGLIPGDDGRLRTLVGHPSDLLETLAPTTFDVVFVDTAALAPMGGAAELSRHERRTLLEAVAPSGVLILGPLRPAAGAWAFPEGWSQRCYRRPMPACLDGMGVRWPESEEVLVGSPDPGRIWPAALDGAFTVVED